MTILNLLFSIFRSKRPNVTAPPRINKFLSDRLRPLSACSTISQKLPDTRAISFRVRPGIIYSIAGTPCIRPLLKPIFRVLVFVWTPNAVKMASTCVGRINARLRSKCSSCSTAAASRLGATSQSWLLPDRSSLASLTAKSAEDCFYLVAGQPSAGQLHLLQPAGSLG